MEQVKLIAGRIDAFCARLNAGLAAVALALAVVVLVAMVFRAQDFMPYGLDPQYSLAYQAAE
ncbi:MAG TPA: hypothetical protein VMU87_14175 [Stellaceae bacterium]|nr:hypothetical protein [Stellaceae bacterium]